MIHRKLTNDEHEALEAFAQAHGIRWRDNLLMDYWYYGKPWNGPKETMGATLLRLYGDLGREWLYEHYKPRPDGPADAKPTNLQLDALEAIRDGKVKMARYNETTFRISAPVITSVIGRVVALRWARWPAGFVAAQSCELTNTGRALLRRYRKPAHDRDGVP